MLTGSGPYDMALLVAPQYLGMCAREPHGRRSGGGCEVNGYAGLVELVDDAIKPIEFEIAVTRLDVRPAEDGQGYDVNASLLHQANVFVLYVFGPLVGVVVRTEPDFPVVAWQGLWPTVRTMLCGC